MEASLAGAGARTGSPTGPASPPAVPDAFAADAAPSAPLTRNLVSVAPISAAEIDAIRRPIPQRGSRVAGVWHPVTATRHDAGGVIGDYTSARWWIDWAAVAGLRMWMMLPIAPGGDDPSPYAALSAFGKSPMLIDLHALPEFHAAGGEAALSAGGRANLAAARGDTRQLRYPEIYAAKREGLRLAFEQFDRQHFAERTPRAAEFEAFVARESAPSEGEWLRHFALFSAIKSEQGGRAWKEWPEPLRSRDPAALAAAEVRLAKEVRFHQWTQWVAQTQWDEVKKQAELRGVSLVADLPISVSHDSVDAWAWPDQLSTELRLGVPPDPFSAVGQDWGTTVMILPQAEAWLRLRARKAKQDAHGLRIDHWFGFTHQYVRPREQPKDEFVPGVFIPGNTTVADLTQEQHDLGARLTRIFLDEGLLIIAEDLGVVPKGAPELLEELGVPGMKVLRWMREWDRKDPPRGVPPFFDPRTYPPNSVTLTNTHDTSAQAVDWEAPSDNSAEWNAHHEALADALPSLAALSRPLPAEYTGPVRDAILGDTFRGASHTLLTSYSDLKGSKDRPNVPGTTEGNWVWCLPVDGQRLLEDPETVEVARRTNGLVEASGRNSPEATYVDLDQRPADGSQIR